MASRLFIRLGAALFIAALASCTWWYIARLDDASPGGGWSAAAVDAALLTIFALHHSVFARDRVKARLARIIPAGLERSVYVWIASILLLLVVALWRHVGGSVYQASGLASIAHAALQLSGVWLIARAVSRIDPLELAGVHHPATRSELQTAGPYGWVRHPLYLGWVIALFGAAHMTGDRLLFATITSLYLMLAVPWEERTLVKSFGEEYRRYQQRVRWRIVPYVF